MFCLLTGEGDERPEARGRSGQERVQGVRFCFLRESRGRPESAASHQQQP